MHRVILFLLVPVLFFSIAGCAAEQKTPAGDTGFAETPALKPGDFLGGKNQWRGGVIGAVPSAVAGNTLKEISRRGSKEAALSNKPVEYTTTDGRAVYKAYPEAYDEKTGCHEVQEKVWEDGKLIKDRRQEVCEVDKPE